MIFPTSDEDVLVRISDRNPSRELLDGIAGADCTVVEVGSTGFPAVEPLVSVTRGERTTFHAQCSPEEIQEFVALTDDSSRADTAAVIEHDPETTTFPAPELFGLDTGVRRVLGGCGWRRPTHPDDHEAAGGFASVASEAVVSLARQLRGRGWGDWSHDQRLIDAWRPAMEADSTAVVVNAHGTTADTLLLSSVPFEVLEGANAAASAVGADRIVVYTADNDAALTVKEAAESYPNPCASIDVVSGPSEYRAAEPTMALEAIEGNHRIEARLRPPGPEVSGLHGEPTLVHTARTFAQLAVALRDGRTESRLITVTGDVAVPATVEVPESDTIETALDAVDIDGEFKAACVGGRFGGITTELDIDVAPDALANADLGTEGTVRIITDDQCVVAFIGNKAQFAADENCGRCVPCREGTTQLANQLREIYDGDYDSDGIEELVRVMNLSSICAFGKHAGRPTRTAMAAFESEFAAHADGRCPAGSCFDRNFAVS